MANVEKLTIGSDTYDLRDASAVHTVDSAMSSSSTNPVQNKVVKEYVDGAIQNEPYIRVAIGFGVMVLFENFTTQPTTYSELVASDDFKMALARPVVVDYGSIGTTIIQGLILNMDSIQASNHWQFRFPDAVVFNGTLTNGLEGDLTYAEGDGWYLDNFDVATPEFKNYTDDAISNISLVSTQVEANATEAATPASGDGLIFADSDDANKLKRMTSGFGTSTTTFLRNDGTWAAPPSSEAPVARIFHGTCSTAAGTTAKVVTCPQFLASDLVTGAIVFVTFTATNSGAVASLTLNVNGTGAKNIKYMHNADESNLPGVGYLRANMTYRFVYNGTYWVCDTDYDADTVTMLTYRTFRVASDAGGSLYSYKLCALDNNGDLIPFNFVSSSPTTTYTKAITTHSFNPFRGFLYYAGTITTSAGSGRDANEFRSAMTFDCRYSLNINSSGTAGSTALTAYDPIYVKALYTASTRLAKLVADTSNSNYLVRSSVVQALPSADPNTGLADGTFYIYILLGQGCTKYHIDMFDNNTVYYWNTKAGMMTEFTGIIEADYATPADISTAISALDASASGLSASKTITALSEENGIISASASDIAIDASQVATGTFASNRIYSDATMATAIESGDSVIFADSSDSNKLKRMTSGFDVSNTTSFLRRDGTWAVPAGGGGGTTGIFKGTCATGAGGDPKVVTCPEFTSSDLVKGAVIFVTFTYTNSASVNSVQMNVNGTGAKRIMQIKNTVLGTMTTNGELVANQTYMFTYDGTYWVLSNDDDRTNVAALGNGHKNIGTTNRYQFLVSAPKDDTNTNDHKRALFAVNAVDTGSTVYTKAFRTWSFDPFGAFAYWNSADRVSSEGTFGDPTRLQIEGSVAGNYAFNLKQNGTAGTQGLADNKAVYMKSKYDFATQTATLWQDTASANYLDRSGLVQELPTTNPNTSTDTYVYIYLGQAYGGDARTFYLLPYHPVYMWNEAKGRMDLFTGGPMEGSGTCTLTDGMSISFTANYYKIGRQVTIWGTIPKYASSALALSGLPYTPNATMSSVIQFQQDGTGTARVDATIGVRSGYAALNTYGYITGSSNNGTFVSNAGTWLNLIPSAGLAFSFTYITDVP